MDEQIIDLIKSENFIGIKNYTQSKAGWRNMTFYEDKYNLLHLVVCCNKPKLIKWLIENGLDANLQTKDGDTALHLAVEVPALQCIKELLAYKANTEIRDFDDEVTPLLKAVKSSQMAAAEILINGGADLQCKDKTGDTPLHLAIDMQELEMVSLLLDKNSNIQIENVYGFTPLHIACRRSDTVRCLKR